MKRSIPVVTAAMGVLLAACGSSGASDATAAATTAPSTTSTVPATTITTQPRSTTTTTVASDVAQAWLDAMGAGQYEAAEQMASASAGRYTHFINVSNQLDSYLAHEGIEDTQVSEGRLEWEYTDGVTVVLDNVVVTDGLVSSFDRNGEAISTMVPDQSGGPVEAGDVNAQISVIYHRENPSVGTVSFLVVEIDNRTTEEIYGWDAQLVGSDRRTVEAELSYNGSYPADAISDDVMFFLGTDLSEGGELRIDVDYDTEVRVPVPAVP